MLIYESDEDRARLLEQKGFTVAFGSINDLFSHFAERLPSTLEVVADYSGDPVLLQPSLGYRTTSVEGAIGQPADPGRMFQGSPATYADIDSGFTFARSQRAPIVHALGDKATPFQAIIGVAGSGKTTLARQALLELRSPSVFAWEHHRDFAFDAAPWLRVAGTLKEQKKRGVLLIDDCTEFLRQVNILMDSLGDDRDNPLSVVITANRALWVPRVKSPYLFQRGSTHSLTTLDDQEIASLLMLLDNSNGIRQLVDEAFKRIPRSSQVRQLKTKCHADMYVCLKNIFGSEQIDTILLQEFADLPIALQDVYRHVAAMEAAGVKIHRQLVIRMLNLSANILPALIEQLGGLVEEYSISEDEGIYGWETRHLVIAQTLTRFKYSDQDEVFRLFRRIIACLNPSIPMELRTCRGICDRDFGIGRLFDLERQNELYRALIDLAPRERIPYHRLIRNLIELGKLHEAEITIKNAERDAGRDSPISRYKIRLLIKRAETTPGILLEDRLALLRHAVELARKAIVDFKRDRYAFAVYCDVGEKIAELGGGTEVFDHALEEMRSAAGRILDPEMGRALDSYEYRRRAFQG